MLTKTTIAVSVDTSIIPDAKRILKEQGIKMSTYINMILVALVEAEKLPMKTVYEKMAVEMIRESTKKKRR